VSAEDAEYRLADVFTGVGVRLHTCRCIVHVYGCLHKCEYVLQGADADSVCVHSWARSRKRSRPHISAALPGCLRIQSFPITLSGEWRGGRAAGCHTGAQNVKWANAAVETSTCVHCHRQATAIQRPTNEQVLLADLHVELWSLFVTSGKLAG